MNSNTKIRAYTPKDKNSVLSLLKLNTPNYFAPEEENDLIHYLSHEIELYYVIQINNSIVGCGGINFDTQKTKGMLSWDMLHPEYQGQSLGSMLVKHRIEKLQTIETVKRITVRTSQLAFRFYEKQGFELLKVSKDYWALGFDLYEMEYNGL